MLIAATKCGQVGSGGHICNINRLVKNVPNNIPINIKSKGIKPQDIGFLSISDVVWANADKFCSQMGIYDNCC